MDKDKNNLPFAASSCQGDGASLWWLCKDPNTAPMMLAAFEYWFGPYPFYEDGYKLVEAPYLGMEHQSLQLMEMDSGTGTGE